MATDYDAIAAEYRLAKAQPWREAIEAFTLMDLIGPLDGLAAVDLACGEGYYTRRLRRGGAARVLGVDRSEGMIELARSEEAARPLGVEYLAVDCSGPVLAGEFDLAVAAYLLNYARDREELAGMARTVAALLRPGGRFVAVDTNPDLDFGRVADFRNYGFEVESPEGPGEGSPIHWTFYLEGGPLRVENYHLPAEARAEALRSAGFQEVHRHRPRAVDGAAVLGPVPRQSADLVPGSPALRPAVADASLRPLGILGLNGGDELVYSRMRR